MRYLIVLNLLGFNLIASFYFIRYLVRPRKNLVFKLGSFELRTNSDLWISVILIGLPFMVLSTLYRSLP